MSESAILCVDDEAVILDSLKEQLKRQFDVAKPCRRLIALFMK